MLQAIGRACGLLSLIAISLCVSQPAQAQIAPTTAASISGSISDSTGKPVANAKVALNGPKNAFTETDAQGLFVFVGVPLGTYTISAASAGLGTATRTGIFVQGDTNVAIQYEPASLNALKVIAQVSSVASAQFNITPASVTQVNPIANAFEGKTSWRTILEQIPGVAQAGRGNGSSAFAALPDSPLAPVQISINGALPYETAILMDDMPLIGGSQSSLVTRAGGGTDLGVYPLNGFGAADVVRGPGASAPSIVDSIGGSFVLHAPGIVNANHYTLSLSTDPYGGIVANAQAAVRWKKFSAIVTYGVNDSPGPMNGAQIPSEIGFSPATVNGTPFSCTGSCAVSYLFDPRFASPASTNNASYPYYGYNNGLLVCCFQNSTAWSQHSGSIALNYQLSPSVSAEVFYAGQTSQDQTNPSPYYTVNFTPPAGYTGNLPAGQQLLSSSGIVLGPELLQQMSSLLEEKITARLGRGLLRLAALQNRTFAAFGESGPTSATQQLFGGGCIASITTSLGCPTGYASTAFNGGTYNVTYPSINQNINCTNNNRDLLLEYATPLSENLHAGVSFVQSYYNIPMQELINIPNYGLIDYTENIPSADSQTTNEFRVFVGGNPSDKTSVDLSAYFANADYHVQNPSDPTGHTYVDERYSYAAPRLGFVWRPTAAIAVRAAAGGGFAEAPLAHLAGSGFGNTNGTPLCVGGTCSVTLTNVNLQPEKSFGFDLGTDIRLRRDTVLSFDVYRTNLYGQLYDSTSSSGSCPTCGGLPLFIAQYGNLGESRYEGVLLDLRHDAPHGIYWSLSGGLTRGYVVSVPSGFYNSTVTTYPPPTYIPTPVLCTNCANLSVVPGVNFNGTFTQVSVPYSQALGTFGYRWNADQYVDLVGTYYGNNNTYFRPAFVELDGHLGYPLTKNASLLITFRNITGIYDGTTQIISPANMSGAPTIAGLPFPLYGEEYGPRTVLVTTRINL